MHKFFFSVRTPTTKKSSKIGGGIEQLALPLELGTIKQDDGSYKLDNRRHLLDPFSSPHSKENRLV